MRGLGNMFYFLFCDLKFLLKKFPVHINSKYTIIREQLNKNKERENFENYVLIKDLYLEYVKDS